MGYFANGFVFTSEPEFKAASVAIPARCARGYKHKERPIWLLDLWKPRGRLQLRRAPFCDPVAGGFRADIAAVDVPTREFLTKLERLKVAIGHRNGDPEQGHVHAALAVAAAARCPVFFFAADDEETDVGCRTVPGSLVSFSGRLDRLSVHYATGQTTVTRLNFLDDGDDEGLQELITKAKGVAGVVLTKPRDIEGGQVLYENPVGQWPTEAGDPAEMLGLGTWDPLSSIEEDFTVVFEHATQ
jgi:hypothetical protein